MYGIRRYGSPLGRITLWGDADALCGLWFDGQKYFGEGLTGAEAPDMDSPALDSAERWLDVYFGGVAPDFTPPVRLSGTPFRLAVWRRLCEVPFGSTITYGELAEGASSEPNARRALARAVGGAVGHNPISIIIPCHRVLGAGGEITGYAGGLERKLWLLRLEGAKL